MHLLRKQLHLVFLHSRLSPRQWGPTGTQNLRDPSDTAPIRATDAGLRSYPPDSQVQNNKPLRHRLPNVSPLRQPGCRRIRSHRPLALRPGLATGLPLSRMKRLQASHARGSFSGQISSSNVEPAEKAPVFRRRSGRLQRLTFAPCLYCEPYVKILACQIERFRKSEGFPEILPKSLSALTFHGLTRPVVVPTFSQSRDRWSRRRFHKAATTGRANVFTKPRPLVAPTFSQSRDRWSRRRFHKAATAGRADAVPNNVRSSPKRDQRSRLFGPTQLQTNPQTRCHANKKNALRRPMLPPAKGNGVSGHE